MRKIRITPYILQLANEYHTQMQLKQMFGDISVDPLNRLKKLKRYFEKGFAKKYVGKDTTNKDVYTDLLDLDLDLYISYIQKIIDYYTDKLLILKPSEMNALISEFESIMPLDYLSAFIKIGRNQRRKFWEIIVSRMMYAEVRRWIFPYYIRRIGVKSCVYCNANYAITDSEGRAYYDLDHWKPKSKYPYLCISFFNLQPCCRSCNMLKGDDDQHEYLGLYEDRSDVPLNLFEFTISDKDISNFIVSHDAADLNIHMGAICQNNKKMCDDMNEKLHLGSVYAEHNDIAAEILWKRIAYNKSFQQAMKSLLSDNNFTDLEIERFILGGYFDEEDTHKRPLTKLIQDIFKTTIP